MALFRHHCGNGLSGSLATTIIVKNKEELFTYLCKYWADGPGGDSLTFSNMVIQPHPDIERCFDERCGWYTHIVTIRMESSGNYCETGQYPLGYLSESI